MDRLSLTGENISGRDVRVRNVRDEEVLGLTELRVARSRRVQVEHQLKVSNVQRTWVRIPDFEG